MLIALVAGDFDIVDPYFDLRPAKGNYTGPLTSLLGELAAATPTPKVIRCLIPRFDGVILSQEWKDVAWDKFVTGAPRPRTPSEQQYSDRKLRSRS